MTLSLDTVAALVGVPETEIERLVLAGQFPAPGLVTTWGRRFRMFPDDTGPGLRVGAVVCITGLPVSVIKQRIRAGLFQAPAQIEMRRLCWRLTDVQAWQASRRVGS